MYCDCIVLFEKMTWLSECSMYDHKTYMNIIIVISRGINSLKPNLIIHKLKCSEVVVDVQWKYDLLSLSLLYNCRILSKTKRVWMRLCSFIYTYLLRNVRIFFLTLISDVRSIMNFSWNVQLINVCPSKTLSFNNIFIFILHNKWVWMKEHNLIHSSYCHVEFHCISSDKSLTQ